MVARKTRFETLLLRINGAVSRYFNCFYNFGGKGDTGECCIKQTQERQSLSTSNALPKRTMLAEVENKLNLSMMCKFK